MNSLSFYIKNNPLLYAEFFLNHIPNSKLGNTEYKILCNCPYCNDIKQHGIVNLDTGFFYCFKNKCFANVDTFLKDYSLYDEFVELVFNNNNLNIDIKELMEEKNNIKSKIVNDTRSDYVKDMGWEYIHNVSTAYQYAMSRVDDEVEVKKYWADEAYIYIPIFFENKIVNYVGRKYIDIPELKRYMYVSSKHYKKYNFKKLSDILGCFDDVIENYNGSPIYITEGYFDAYSINRALNSYNAVCLFGKTMSDNQLKLLNTYFPFDTTFYLVLDSQEKDKDIRLNVEKITRKVKQYFQDIKIIQLPYSDPNDLFLKGNLKNTLLNINPMNYIDYKLYNPNIRVIDESLLEFAI